MRRLFVVATCVAALGAGAAYAGEVKGPPGTPGAEDTAAPTHASSICAFSGLNDFEGGQTVSQVQTAADSWKFYGGDHGTPGQACRGGSNPEK
jgi:hypothetical protein